jgi:hypothetical protein
VAQFQIIKSVSIPDHQIAHFWVDIYNSSLNRLERGKIKRFIKFPAIHGAFISIDGGAAAL